MPKSWWMVVSNIKSRKDQFIKLQQKLWVQKAWNGWTYWHCNINGSTVVIDSLRQKFISEKQI